MNPKFKLAAYIVLLILAAWFGHGFFASYSTATKQAEPAANEAAPYATREPSTTTNGSNTADTNTNAAVRNGAETSNSAVTPSNPQARASAPGAPPPHGAQGKMFTYLAAFVGTLVGLGLLIASDVTQYLGGMAVDALLDDRGEGARDPEYEKAEQAWADGKYLEAIQMMREFLKTHPREQYAALRIAEIYEKDLHNFVAAALEYEEVLKKKLPAERWGWAAVHLCNLYSKLGQQEKTRALLQRIADEFPKTAAAKKARERLGLPQLEPERAATPAPAETAAAPIETEVSQEEEAKPESPPPPAAPPAPTKPKLPPGFRPK